MSIPYHIISDIGCLSGMNIMEYLLCYSIHYNHNVFYLIHIFSLSHVSSAFVYVIWFSIFLLLLISITWAILFLPGLTTGLPAQALETLMRIYEQKILPSRSKHSPTDLWRLSYRCNYLMFCTRSTVLACIPTVYQVGLFCCNINVLWAIFLVIVYM